MGSPARDLQDRPTGGADRHDRHLPRRQPPRGVGGVHGVRFELLHSRGARLRAQARRHHRGEPFPDDPGGDGAQGDVRRDMGQPRPRRGRDGEGGGADRDALPREPAGVRLLPHALPPVQGLPRRRRGGPGHLCGGLRGLRRVEQALRLPEGRRGGRHPQAREVQGLHHRRQRRPGQDLRGAGRDQVLPGAKRPRAGAGT